MEVFSRGGRFPEAKDCLDAYIPQLIYLSIRHMANAKNSEPWNSVDASIIDRIGFLSGST